MANEKRIYVSQGGIQCDTVGCDYRDEAAILSESLIGTPCPECGANLLTKEDYERAQQVEGLVAIINRATDEEMQQVSGEVREQVDYFKTICKNYGVDIDVLAEDTIMGVTINTHKEVKIESASLFPVTWMGERAQDLTDSVSDNENK